jgi:sugar lactone lactonase YvrE
MALIALIGLACGKERGAEKKAEPPATAVAPAETPSAPAPPAATPESPDSIDVKDVGFATPESVLYDDVEDVYLVSNINGNPPDMDDNGFISRVDPDGKLRELKWIDGTTPEVKLSAPKGMALLGDTLYVADINAVRMFDRKTGAPKGDVAIKGATFLNDMTTAGDSVYVSDSGFTRHFTPSKTDAIHKIDASGKSSPLLADPELGRPNGLAPAEDGLWVVTFGSGQVFRVGSDGARQKAEKLPKGQLDGIIALEGGVLLVSSWEAKAVLRGAGRDWRPIISDLEAPADIGFDTKRRRVLVPLFMANALAIRALPE